MQILGSIFVMFSQGKITKDELDKAGKIESDLNMLEDKSNSEKQTDEATQSNNNSDENKDSNQQILTISEKNLFLLIITRKIILILQKKIYKKMTQYNTLIQPNFIQKKFIKNL